MRQKASCALSPFLCIAALLFTGNQQIPSLLAGEKNAALSFVTVDKGLSSGIRERKVLVIKTAREWVNLWLAHKSTGGPAKEIPPVNFEQEMVAAVFLGEKQTGGYAIEITRVEEDSAKRELDVFFREIPPSPGSVVSETLTQPYHMIKLKKVVFPAAFIPLEGAPGG